jgi:hypothetical protein
MRVRKTLATAAVLALAGALTTTGAAGATTTRSLTAQGPCGLLAYDAKHRPAYQHVVVIMDENLSAASFQASTQAPYLHGLAAACGSEADMHAATHPSQANYMAATSGVATASGLHSTSDNVFHQLQVAGKTWRDYAESMPTSCARQSAAAPTYRTGHTPAFWYTDLTKTANTCKQDDVPMSPALDQALATDKLPAFSWITPDLCDDMHWVDSCGYPTTSRVAAGDAWLGALIPRLTALPSYQAGHTLIIVTFDEGDGDDSTTSTGVDCTSAAYDLTHPDCQIPTIVASAYVKPGSVDTADHNLYTLLGTIEDILGLPRLGLAKNHPNLRAGLGF